jgi:hypothetical protein
MPPNPSFERTCAKSRAGRSIQTLEVIMPKLLEHIDWGTIAMAFAFAYAAPVLLACSMEPTLWLFAFWVGSPFAAGYLAARYAPLVPQLHALVVGVIGTLVHVLLHPARPLLFWLIWTVVIISCSLYGARLCQRRQQRS